MSATANSNNANTPVVTPRMNYTESEIVNTMTTPSPRTLGKKALNQMTQYITPEYRKHYDEELGYQVFQIKNNSGKWRLADAFGNPTNCPNEASVRAKHTNDALSLFNANNVITHIQSPAKGGRRRKSACKARKARKTRGCKTHVHKRC